MHPPQRLRRSVRVVGPSIGASPDIGSKPNLVGNGVSDFVTHALYINVAR